MQQSYNTKQRKRILDYLKLNAHRCLSADEIIEGISTEEKRASKATVYRCLELFTGEGVISRYIGVKGEGAVYRFSGEHNDHFHLKCTSCDTTVCVDCGFINRMQRHFYDSHGFTVSKTQTMIYGLCKSCSEKENKLK